MWQWTSWCLLICRHQFRCYRSMMRNVQNNFIKTELTLLNVLSRQQPQMLRFSGDYRMRQKTRILFCFVKFQLSVKSLVSRSSFKWFLFVVPLLRFVSRSESPSCEGTTSRGRSRRSTASTTSAWGSTATPTCGSTSQTCSTTFRLPHWLMDR